MSSGITPPHPLKPPTLADVCDWRGLIHAHQRAARGKRGRGSAARFEFRLADELLELQVELNEESYRPGRYVSFAIHEPKRRLISAAPFRDRVVHHALCATIEPHFERRFIADSYANRIGKGTHRAIRRAQQFAKRYRYVLTCDIRQHFASIDHAILHDTLARVIRHPPLLRLCDRILESGDKVLRDDYDMVYFPGDDLFAVCRPRGVPIGNLTSQFWSNCYLNPFDHFVKRELHCRGYVRYVDDLLLFGDKKSQLWVWKKEIIDRLASLRLTLHEGRSDVQPVERGIPWLGFVVYPTHRRIKRRKVIRQHRRIKSLLTEYHAGRISFGAVDASIRGWIEHARHGDTWGLRTAVLRAVRLRARPLTAKPTETLQ